MPNSVFKSSLSTSRVLSLISFIWFLYFSQHLQHWYSGQYRLPHSLVPCQETCLHLPVTGLCRRHRPPWNGQTGSGWLHPVWGHHWGYGQHEVIRSSSTPGGVHVFIIFLWELNFYNTVSESPPSLVQHMYQTRAMLSQFLGIHQYLCIINSTYRWVSARRT